MSEQDLVGCYIKIKLLCGADPNIYKFDVGDVLEVVNTSPTSHGSILFTFKNKPHVWSAGSTAYEIIAHPTEWYKDKWLVFTHNVGYGFLQNTPYHIKECCSTSNTAFSFTFYNAPYNTWNHTAFHVADNHFKIVDAPVKKEESLLEEARRRYPVGTKYKCVRAALMHVVEKQTFEQHNPTTIFGEPGKGCLYVGGKWAEIVTTATEPISSEQIAGFIREAERRYPKGTKYIPTSRYSRNTDESSGTFIWNSSDRVEDKVNGTGIYEPKKNKWAEIIHTVNPDPVSTYSGISEKVITTAPESKIQHIPDLNVSLRKSNSRRHIKHL